MKKYRVFEWSRMALPALGLVATAACSDDPTAAEPPRPSATLPAGEWSVVVDPNRPSIRLAKGDETLLDFPADGLEIGTLPVVDDATNYDPYPLFVPVAFYPAPEVAWFSPSRVDVTSANDQKIELALDYGGGIKATLGITTDAAGRFTAELVPAEGSAKTIAYFRLRPRASETEGFYGLGEYFDDVEHRGKIRAMQIEIDSSIESSYNEAHVPIPFLVGTHGWGLFVESQHPAVFSIAKDEKDLVDAVFGAGTASAKGLRFHLFGAPHPLDVTRHYYDVTGYPRLPAPWALGPWIWRDENKDQAEVLSDIAAMRSFDLATTGYWIDRPYASGVNTFDFNAPQFPDPQGMIDEIHAAGFRAALWHTPYLDESDPSTKALRDVATAGQFFPLETSLKLNKWGLPIDFTRPEAYSFWQTNIEKYTSMGIEGFKLDYGEDIVPGLTSARSKWVFSDGSDERTMHMGYTLLYHQVYAETLPQSGGFLLCRHAAYGDQKNGPIIWPGDLDASFAKHRENVKDPGGDYVAVGGLPAAVVASLSLGPSGFPFFGSDTGGYRHSPPDKELFTRWFEHTALSTVMQVGNSANTVPWEPDPATGYDEEMLGWYRTYARLHLRLFPYEWTYAKNLLTDGRPIQRALGLAYPELGAHPNDEYMFGDDLLVAPVTERGVTSRDVVFPPGNWIDWWTGEVIEGGTTKTVAAPLGTLPLYLREGGVVPMLRPTIDTIGPTSKPAAEVDSYATTPGVLWARMVPSEKRSFVVFDGATIDVERTGTSISLAKADGQEFKDGVMFELIAMGNAPATVSIDGATIAAAPSLADLAISPTGFVFVPGDAGGTLYVKVGPGAHTAEIGL